MKELTSRLDCDKLLDGLALVSLYILWPICETMARWALWAEIKSRRSQLYNLIEDDNELDAACLQSSNHWYFRRNIRIKFSALLLKQRCEKSLNAARDDPCHRFTDWLISILHKLIRGVRRRPFQPCCFFFLFLFLFFWGSNFWKI